MRTRILGILAMLFFCVAFAIPANARVLNKDILACKVEKFERYGLNEETARHLPVGWPAPGSAGGLPDGGSIWSQCRHELQAKQAAASPSIRSIAAAPSSAALTAPVAPKAPPTLVVPQPMTAVHAPQVRMQPAPKASSPVAAALPRQPAHPQAPPATNAVAAPERSSSAPVPAPVLVEPSRSSPAPAIAPFKKVERARSSPAPAPPPAKGKPIAAKTRAVDDRNNSSAGDMNDRLYPVITVGLLLLAALSMAWSLIIMLRAVLDSISPLWSRVRSYVRKRAKSTPEATSGVDTGPADEPKPDFRLIPDRSAHLRSWMAEDPGTFRDVTNDEREYPSLPWMHGGVTKADRERVLASARARIAQGRKPTISHKAARFGGPRR